MPEILTESFCERCGTRYTFESSAPRGARLKGIKVVSRGLKNFVMSDDTSLDEAMAAARSETDREVTSQQLDAFHKTFNFCMSCRQYTCGNCWNEADGQCLSCSPHLGHEILPAPFPDLPAGAPIGLDDAALNGHDASVNGHPADSPTIDAADALAWPTLDLDQAADVAPEPIAADEPEPIDAAARLAFLGALPTAAPATDVPDEPGPAEAAAPAEAMPTVEPAAPVDAPTPADDVAALTPPVEAVESASAITPAGVDAEDVPGRAAAAADQTKDLLQRFRPGESLDAEIEAYEREQAAIIAADAAEPGPTIDDAAAVAALAAAASIAEPPAREQPAAPEPVAAEAPSPMAEVAPVPEAAAPAPEAAEPGRRDDLVAQPTWQIVAPEAPPVPGAEPVAPPAPVAPPPAASAEPQWPTQPAWPSHQPAGGLPYAQPAATGGLDQLWAESAREVTAIPTVPAAAAVARGAMTGVQPCVSCGLSLSATARFCRRCGTRQG
jgi:hypothetical protein